MIFLTAQYTPGIQIVFTAWIKSHDQGSEAFEQVPLLWFGEIIGSHHLCWAVLNDHILAVYLLLDQCGWSVWCWNSDQYGSTEYCWYCPA